MNKSTKILAGISTALILGGAGTATYFGVTKNNLQKDYDKYVQESTLRDEEAQKKLEEFEEANKTLEDNYNTKSEELAEEIENNKAMKEELKYFQENMLAYTFDDTTKTASVKGKFSAMKKVVIPEKVLHNGEEYAVISLQNYAFLGYANLEEVVLPSSLQIIGVSSFENCSALKNIVVPANVTTIDANAFHSVKTNEISFENKIGWVVNKSSGDISLTEDDFSDANIQSTIANYSNSKWTRTETSSDSGPSGDLDNPGTDTGLVDD